MNTIKRILPLHNKDLIDTTNETLHKNITLISSYINKAFDKIIYKDTNNDIIDNEECFIDPEDQCYDFINIKIDSSEQVEKNIDDEYELREIKIIN